MSLEVKVGQTTTHQELENSGWKLRSNQCKIKIYYKEDLNLFFEEDTGLIDEISVRAHDDMGNM